MLVVLDPNVKDLYCRHQWEPEQYAAGMAKLEEVVNIFTHFPICLQYANICLIHCQIV